LKDNQGNSLKNIVIFGDSVEYGLTLGSILKMRNSVIRMPTAVVVFSPWTNVTLKRDTYFTLKDADPSIVALSLKNFAPVYANPSGQKIPYFSPIYGNLN
jgi:epsilon-lactone hydrolase